MKYKIKWITLYRKILYIIQAANSSRVAYYFKLLQYGFILACRYAEILYLTRKISMFIVEVVI